MAMPTTHHQEVRKKPLLFHHPIPFLRHPATHPILRKTLPELIIQSKLGGRLRYFLDQWMIITNDQEILNLIRGWDIPFIEPPRETLCQNSFISMDDHALIDQEISEMLEKGAIQKTSYAEGQVLSSLFLREKKDGSQRPILNLKKLNQNIPYLHFKMESLKDVKNIIQEGD